jgi:hypothetical protein
MDCLSCVKINTTGCEAGITTDNLYTNGEHYCHEEKQMGKGKKNFISMMELRHARMTIENLHTKLKEGYAVEGDGLVDVVNAMLSMLHDVVQAAESHNVTVDGSKVIGTRPL